MSKARTIGVVNKIESNLNARLETDFGTVQTVTDQTRNVVLASLNPSGNFLIDGSIASKIDQIVDLFSTRKSDLEAYRNRLSQDLADTINEITSITTTYGTIPTNTNIARRLLDAQTKETNLTAKVAQLNASITEISTNRITEYEDLKTEINKLDLTRDLPDMKGTTYNAGADLMKPGMAAGGYSFYDKDGTEINGGPHPTNYFIDIKLADGTSQNLKIENLQINAGVIDITGITFRDRALNPVIINQAYEFTINPGAIVTLPGTGGGINRFIHSKPLKIIRPNPAALTSATRLTQLTNYNAVSHSVERAMTAIYDTEIKEIEKKAFFDGLKHADGPKFDKLTDAQKEDLYNRVRKKYMSGGIPNPALGRATTKLNNIDNYNTGTLGFATWITSDDHPFSKDKEINKDANARRNNLSNELENQIQLYFKNRFDEAFTKDPNGNTFLKAHLTEYFTELKENTKETLNGHMNSALDLAAIKMNTQGSKFNIFTRKDNNYMKFLTGKSIDIPEQTLQLKREIKYTMHLEISPKHQLISKIKINDKEVGIKGKDPMDLMQNILKNPAIKEGETRMHIAYNVMSGLIQMVNKEDINLSSPAGTNTTMKMDGKDIILETLDPTSRLTKVDKIFDYSLFDATKSWTDPNMSGRSVPTPNIRTLRTGIELTTQHFNACMNTFNDNFNEALEKNIVPKFPTSRGTSPIKKLLNYKNVMDFDFETSLTENGKNISISRTKNVFTLKIDDVEIKGKNLSKLLKKRKNGIRLFDGVERAICGEIYKTLIDKLRENTKIANSNFGVIDPISKKMYILDEDGQLGYLLPQDVVSNKDYQILPHSPTSRTMCSESESKEVYKNPLLMGRLMKIMNIRLGKI